MINSVIIEGNLVRDPELRFLPKGTAVCEASLANTQRFSTGSERKESTSFVGLVLFGTTAESFAKWHRKGSRVIVEGELTQQTWVDKVTQTKREKTKVKVSKWHFAGSKRETPEPAATATESPGITLAKLAPAPVASLSDFANPTDPTDPAAAEPEEDEIPF